MCQASVEIMPAIEPRPIMLVAGGQPNPLYGAESWLTGFMFEHAGEHARLWVIPDAYHCDGPSLHPEEYADKLVEFFDTAFGIERLKKTGHALSVTRSVYAAFFLFGRGRITNALARKAIVATANNSR
jgi:hypothetical protein